jgi:hypothetical protein
MSKHEHKVQYPNFDVMHEEKHWDDHTREIVNQRLQTTSLYPLQFLTLQEANTLSQLCSLLLDDHNHPVIAFVVHHFDSTLRSSVGESQRHIGVPTQTVLIRDGLALLDRACLLQYGSFLDGCENDIQGVIISELMQGSFQLLSEQKHINTHDFMQKILAEAVSAYYSYPSIWSEIGYAGPAYPRGYIRSELGLTDPWEAKKE